MFGCLALLEGAPLTALQGTEADLLPSFRVLVPVITSSSHSMISQGSKVGHAQLKGTHCVCKQPMATSAPLIAG